MSALVDKLSAEKPIAISSSNTTVRYKRTFPFDATSGQLLISSPASTEEELLLASKEQFAGFRLLRGLWQAEIGGDASGTYFPVAAPAGEGVVWGSAGRCLEPSTLRQGWRGGYGFVVRPVSPSSSRAVCTAVDLTWLKHGLHLSDLTEASPSETHSSLCQPACVCGRDPTQLRSLSETARTIIDPNRDVVPGFGFMRTQSPSLRPQQLLIPCARQLTPGDAVCVLGFAAKPSVAWARTFLRTEEDYQDVVQKAQCAHTQQLPVGSNWQLDSVVAQHRCWHLYDDVCYPANLVAAPGRVAATSQRIVEHTCSTFPGMSGSPGVDMREPWKLLFVHVRADSDCRRNNYGHSVHHPLFVKAYVREVLPPLLATPPQLLTPMMAQCLYEYLRAHADEIEDGSVLGQVAQRL